LLLNALNSSLVTYTNKYFIGGSSHINLNYISISNNIILLIRNDWKNFLCFFATFFFFGGGGGGGGGWGCQEMPTDPRVIGEELPVLVTLIVFF
jgi:hypothetical protein